MFWCWTGNTQITTEMIFSLGPTHRFCCNRPKTRQIWVLNLRPDHANASSLMHWLHLEGTTPVPPVPKKSHGPICCAEPKLGRWRHSEVLWSKVATRSWLTDAFWISSVACGPSALVPWGTKGVEMLVYWVYCRVFFLMYRLHCQLLNWL